MAKVLFALFVLALTAFVWSTYPTLRARMPDDFQKLSGPEREARARAAREAMIREKYQAAGVQYPSEIFLRWFKHEAQLELWARSDAGRFRLITTYPILKTSGGLGPKRREGDRQVPEGFYVVDRFNPESLYHLSLGLNYPNAADRIHGDPQRPGGDIFIHGKDVSIGCAPLGDEAIEEVYVAAVDMRETSQRKIQVHIFPARMDGPAWEKRAAEETKRRPELTAFWAQLQPAYAAFERDRLVPEMRITNDGRYELRGP
jgi:murein L,D-transpeptidase YafK